MTPKRMRKAAETDEWTKERLSEEVACLRRRLEESEQTLQAIQSGDVDALVVSGPQGEQIFSLASAEHLYRVIVETMNEAAVTVSEQGTILYSNRRFCELMRTPLEAIIGSAFLSFVAPPQQARAQDLIAGAEAYPIVRLTLLASDGTRVPMQICASPLESTEKSICLVAADLSELEASRERLRALASELNLAEQRERKRIATELHDHLQQMLVFGKLKLGQGKKLVRQIPACVDIMQQIDDVLAEALKYTRTLVAELSPPVLRDHGLAAGLKWLGNHMKGQNLAVNVTVPQDHEMELPGDQVILLFQSVRELLINSSKHAGTGEAALIMEHRDGNLSITVSDQGKGFDLSALAGGPSSGGEISSKFGLFSIRERMRALGGSFNIHSAPGQGTSATLTLPLSSGTIEAAAGRMNGAEKLAGSSSLRAQHFAHHDTSIRVLLVDDHAMVRQGLRSLLDAYDDIQVVGEAQDGLEVVRLAEELRPHVVVMDINMPKMNGIEATTRIKARWPETLVIGISVNTGHDTSDAMERAGAAVLLTKEAAVDELYAVIRREMSHAARSVVNQ